MRAFWKHAQPTSLRNAFELCRDFAQENRRMSVAAIAELMGIKTNTFYNYMEEGSMPSNMIRGFESHCGCHYVSSWLVTSSGARMVIDIPTGRTLRAIDVQQLQAVLHTAVGKIIDWAAKRADVESVLAAIHAGLAGLAWHHTNISKAQQPELEFGGNEHEN